MSINWLLILLHFINVPAPAKAESPLAMYSKEWNAPQYLECNTAARARYMSDSERKVVYILNLARKNPQLFCETVVKPLAYDKTSSYYLSLVETMSKMEPLGILYPDSGCYASAHCHAYSTGITGYTGHERQTAECRKVQRYNGECCDYGTDKPLDIILELLTDEDVPSLGHRQICLGDRYTGIGTSIQPHKQYSHVAVIDVVITRK